VLPDPAFRTSTRLRRDHWVRVLGSDYSVQPRAIGRWVDVRADLTSVTVHLGHVHRVEADVGLLRQPEQLGAMVLAEAVDRASPAVAVDEGGETLATEPLGEPADLACRQVQDGRRLLERQLTGR
jgi:hypothetical protein